MATIAQIEAVLNKRKEQSKPASLDDIRSILQKRQLAEQGGAANGIDLQMLERTGRNLEQLQQKGEKAGEQYDKIKQAQILADQSQQEDQGMLSQIGSGIKEAFTGSERETQASRELPELAFSGILSGEDTATVAKISPALLTTLDPAETVKIIKANFPHIGVIQDEKGNLIMENPKTGAVAMVNKPGMSPTDILQGAGLAAEFTPAARIGAGASTVPRKMAAVGAGTGLTETANQALQEAAGGTFDIGDIGLATAGGAAFEGIFQGLAAAFPVFREQVKTAGGKITDSIRQSFKEQARKEGQNADEITDDVIKEILYPETAAVEGEKEFGIQLTKGQRTGVQEDLRQEDLLRAGTIGTSASQETMLAQREAASKQAREAAARLQQEVAGEAPLITSQQEAGALAKQGIRNIEKQAGEAVGEAYEAVGDAAMKPEAFTKMFDAMKKSIRGIDYPVTSETPATTSLLKQISSAQKLFKKEGVKIKPQHIQRIEQIRRSINAQIKTAANPTDKRNLQTMKNTYDDFVDNAMRDALFEGDQDALNALKSSRSLFKEYASKFREQKVKTPSGRTISDQPGKMVETIIAGDPTDAQVVNSLFGAGNTFGNAAAKNMASRFKTILGKDSPEWSAVRQAAFKRLMRTMGDGKTISGKQTQKAINDAIAKNKELMDEVFTAEEIGTFKRFAAHIVRSQPDIERGLANPSGSGRVAVEGMKKAIDKLSTMLGLASGNPAFIVAGQGVKYGSTFGAEKTAKEAVKPFAAIVRPKPELIGGATAATMGTASE